MLQESLSAASLLSARQSRGQTAGSSAVLLLSATAAPQTLLELAVDAGRTLHIGLLPSLLESLLGLLT